MEVNTNFTKIPNKLLRKDYLLKPIHRLVICHLLSLRDNYYTNPTRISKELNTTFYSINNALIEILNDLEWEFLVKEKIENYHALKSYGYKAKYKPISIKKKVYLNEVFNV